MLTVSIIGCGRLGCTIARLLKANHAVAINGIVNSSLGSAQKAIDFIGEGMAFKSISELPPSDVYFITTRDDLINEICKDLVHLKVLKKGSIVIHCSGSLSSDILISAKSAGCLIASVHPVRSFANPEATINSFKGTYCAFDGDDQAMLLIKGMFESIGGKIFKINKDKKRKYHAAMAMANNYLVTLHFHATKNLISAGVEDGMAKQLVSNVMLDAFNNLKDVNHNEALTGPLQRGDIKTISDHLESLEDDSIGRGIYSSLGIGTLPITRHPPELKMKIDKILKDSMRIVRKTHLL